MNLCDREYFWLLKIQKKKKVFGGLMPVLLTIFPSPLILMTMFICLLPFKVTLVL